MSTKLSAEALEKTKKVCIRYCVSSPASAHGSPRVLQDLVNLIIPLKRRRYPSFVSLMGATMDPLQVVIERVPDRSLIEYLEEHPEASRIHLVSHFPFVTFGR